MNPPRSPIEAMIDQATGYRLTAPKSPPKPLDEATKALLAVADLAIRWWESKCPVGWTQARHLQMPKVNTSTARECELAQAVAALVELGWREGESK